MTRFDLESTYLGLDGQGEVTRMPVGPDFWETIDSNPGARGAMVAISGGDGDWSHWEVHPEGEEVLVLIEGSLTLVLQRPGGDERHDMTVGETFVVPRGVWHRAVDQKNAKLLFITYGAGTQGRPAEA